MIPWWWAIVALFAGACLAFVVIALITANEKGDE